MDVRLSRLVGVICLLVGLYARAAQAEEPGGPLASPNVDSHTQPRVKPRHADKLKTAHAGQPSAKRNAKDQPSAKRNAKDQPSALDPWAAVDPGRTVRGHVTPDESRSRASDGEPLSYGMKWNSSNTGNPGSASTGALVNQYNHTMGAPSAVGTDAEVGVRLKF